jgi:hypothetical protein
VERKPKSLIVDIDFGVRVHGEGELQIFEEFDSKVFELAEAAPKLGHQRGPRDERGAFEAMEPIGQPSIDI